jgi:hypothetical protein
VCIRKHMKMFQQLKLSNFVKRKGDNNDAVIGASKQSKSSSINDDEIVHASPASKACNCKSETKSGRWCCSGKKCQDSFRIHGFPILPGSCMRMA